MEERSAAEREIRYVGGGPAEKPIFYVNQIQLISSLYDVQLHLNRIVDQEGKTLNVICQGTLAMSPQHAKSMALLILKNIRDYESQFGQLSVPDRLSEVDSDPE